MEDVRFPSFTAEPVAVTFKAVNTGKAVWRAQTQDGKGVVHLGWRWFRGERDRLYFRTTRDKLRCLSQYLCQLRKAEGGLRGMNTAQAGDLVENLA